MDILGKEIQYVDVKARPELWPVIGAEVERLQKDNAALLKVIGGYKEELTRREAATAAREET